jgi:hypothetical protein
VVLLSKKEYLNLDDDEFNIGSSSADMSAFSVNVESEMVDVDTLV